MTNLLTWNYWFTLEPEALIPLAQQIFIGLIIFLALAALVVALLKNGGGIYRGLFKRVYSFCLTNALLGLILLFFNYETVPFLSARFWLGAWAVTMIVWLVFIGRQLKSIPVLRKQLEQEKEFKKYLP